MPVASFLLRSLAFADGFFLVNWLFAFAVNNLLLFTEMEESLRPDWLYVRFYTYPLLFMGQTITIWLTVLIAGSRFVAVCLPYHVHDYCSLSSVRRAVAALVTFSVVYNVPRYFEAQVCMLLFF